MVFAKEHAIAPKYNYDWLLGKIDNGKRKSELKIDIASLPDGRSEVNVMCFDLVYFTRTAQFVILSAAVFFFYLLYGYFQVIESLTSIWR